MVVPQFRLHGLFGAGGGADSNGGAGAGEGVGREAKGAAGARRKRPTGTAVGSGAGSIAPPQPRRGGVVEAGDAGFLGRTKDSLVRSSFMVRGSDYDADEEDMEFLERLNANVAGAGGDSSRGLSGGERSAVNADLFEAMIERLERQESRARDVSCI